MSLHVISHNYGKIKVGSYDCLPLEKAMTFQNVIILIKSVWNKNKNNYCYNIFLEKASYELPKNWALHNMTELIFLKELMLIRQANQKSVIIATVGIF